MSRPKTPLAEACQELTTTAEGPDLKRLADALARHDVEYILVGGIASRAHGAQRPTYDVDCLPAPSRQNLERLAAAMRDLHAGGCWVKTGPLACDRSRPLGFWLRSLADRAMDRRQNQRACEGSQAVARTQGQGRTDDV